MASPNFLHKEMALAGIASGKHLFAKNRLGALQKRLRRSITLPELQA